MTLQEIFNKNFLLPVEKSPVECTFTLTLNETLVYIGAYWQWKEDKYSC